MTCIFAASFADCAVIGSDSMRRDLNGAPAAEFDKTRKISRFIAGAKFGFGGPETDRIWNLIDAQPESVKSEVDRLLSFVANVGQPINEERRDFFAAQGQGDYGLTLLFASFDPLRGSGIHGVDFKNGHGTPISFQHVDVGPKVMAIGPGDAQAIAHSIIQNRVAQSPEGFVVKVAEFGRDTITAVAAASPTEVALPAFVRRVSAGGVQAPQRLAAGGIILDPMIAKL